MLRGKGLDRGQAGKVQQFEADMGIGMAAPDQRLSCAAFFGIARGQDHFGAGAGQRQRGFQAQSSGRAGHDCQPARLVGNIAAKKIAGGPARHICYPSFR